MAVFPPAWPEDGTPPPRKSVKIKIIIDGSHPKHMKVVNAETGELIKGVRSMRIEGRVGEFTRAFLEFRSFELELRGRFDPVSPKGEDT